MKEPKVYFELKMSELQSLARWAAECAERALPEFERAVGGDSRPRKAIEAAKEFAEGGRRSNVLRKKAMDAYRASLETGEAAASAAARSASLAAASAFTHPFRDRNQCKHILGAAVYTALAVEFGHGDGEEAGDREIERAIGQANSDVAALLGNMPELEEGQDQPGQLYRMLDCGIRAKLVSP